MKNKIWLPIVLLLAVVVAALYWFFLQGPSTPPSLTEAPAPQVQALTWEQLLESLADKPGSEIREHGVRFYQAGDPDKAFLLFKQAAKKSDGWSAMVIGEMYDPATFAAEDFDPKRTAFTKPNPHKALQWYDQAIRDGEPQAKGRRDALILHLREAASGGDQGARRLLQKLK